MVEANWLKMHRATNITYSVDQPISVDVVRSHILHLCATYLQQGLLSRGPRGESAEWTEWTLTCQCQCKPLQTFPYDFISVINQLDAQNFCFTISLFHASTCFEHMCSSSGGQSCITQSHHHTYRCDDTRDCVMQFWSPDDEHICSKHVEAWNKLIVKQKFCASSWLITAINILRCTVSKTSKYPYEFLDKILLSQGGEFLGLNLELVGSIGRSYYIEVNMVFTWKHFDGLFWKVMEVHRLKKIINGNFII